MSPLSSVLSRFARLVGILSLLIASLAPGLSAQGARTQVPVTGVVRNADGEIVAGAVVRTGNMSTTTDASGRYRLDLPPGTHTLKVQVMGFATVTQSVDVAAGRAAVTDFTLPSSGGGGQRSPASPWFGAQLAYNLGGSGSAADNLDASARTVLDILDTDGMPFLKGAQLFVMGNIAQLRTAASEGTVSDDQRLKLRQLQQSSSGVQFGISPTWIKGDMKQRGRAWWLDVGFKLNALKDAKDSVQYLQQLRFGAGVEWTGFKGSVSEMPVSLVVAPSMTLVGRRVYEGVFGTTEPVAHLGRHVMLPSIETSLVIPAGLGRGVAISAIASAHLRPVVSFGLIFTGKDDRQSTTGR